MKHISLLIITLSYTGLSALLTRVVRTPQSKAGLDWGGAAGVWMNSKSTGDSAWIVVMVKYQW
jgi:hypothetical protein